MISSVVKIFVDENEFDFDRRDSGDNGKFNLDSETSVSKLKAHFFETLANLGEVVKYKRDETKPGGKLARAVDADNAIVACFHEQPPELPCRSLQHTKGGLMLPGGFLNRWTAHTATVLLVTSQSQARRLTNAFHHFPIHVMPFYPRLDHHFLDAADGNDSDLQYKKKSYDLLYAGRLIANKGHYQLIRALNKWKCSAKTLALVGEFEQDFTIDQSGATHANFPQFHAREVSGLNRNLEILQGSALPSKQLASKYRQAEIFAYPSIHEDENYGLAPREAAACGAIPLVTDLCGLGEFGRKAHGGIVRTWATLGGIRFSLREIPLEAERILSWDSKQKKAATNTNKGLVASECSGANSLTQMKEAVHKLVALPVAPPPTGGWRCPDRLKRLAKYGPTSFREALSCGSDADPDGLYVDGTGYHNKSYSEARFLTAIQGLYTTWPTPPKLLPGVGLRGFWRVGLFNDERALIEYGFPGPRLLRFSESEWPHVQACARQSAQGEVSFEIANDHTAGIFQEAVDLGYLVPDDPESCILPEPNDTLPKPINPTT